MADKQGSNRESEVGYGKPPIGTQWKPGQSGNPKGRPKDPGITAIQCHIRLMTEP